MSLCRILNRTSAFLIGSKSLWIKFQIFYCPSAPFSPFGLGPRPCPVLTCIYRLWGFKLAKWICDLLHIVANAIRRNANAYEIFCIKYFYAEPRRVAKHRWIQWLIATVQKNAPGPPVPGPICRPHKGTIGRVVFGVVWDFRDKSKFYIKNMVFQIRIAFFVSSMPHDAELKFLQT